MPRTTRSVATAIRKKFKEEESSDEDPAAADSSGSDLDSDLEDPDSIEVPGGGKTLKEVEQSAATAPLIKQEPTESSSSFPSSSKQISDVKPEVLPDIKPPLKVDPPDLVPVGPGTSNGFSASPPKQDGFSPVEMGKPIPPWFVNTLLQEIQQGEMSYGEMNRILNLALSNMALYDVLYALIKQQEMVILPWEKPQHLPIHRTPVELLRNFESMFHHHVKEAAAKARRNELDRSKFGNQNQVGLNNGNATGNYKSQSKGPVRYRPSVEALWGTSSLKAQQFGPIPGQEPMPEEEQNENEGEEMGVEETYSDYMPAKLKIGKRHPDSIVETASLASVLPPDVTYELKLPGNLIKTGVLSALQLESIVYACQQHSYFLPGGERAGFLIGDGAGVGKGRTIAGIIYENYLRKRKKSIWVTVSNDLKFDTERDLSDIGANIPIYQLSKFKYGKIEACKDGVLFMTYNGLIGESTGKSKLNTRFKQVLQWCGPNYDGLIVFDECHRAKNLVPHQGKPTKTGVTVQKLQNALPKARVVYASATGASEPKNMAYMTRLGVWGEKTPFRDFKAFINGVERRGVGAMEIVAMDMKLRGTYIARQLSFKGVRFTIEEVPVSDTIAAAYDASVKFWVEAMNKFVEGTVLMNYTCKQRKGVWTAFWGAHQRFFKYLCIASKVKHCIQLARNAIKDGKCVVIGLQSTGEARTLDQLEKDDGDLADFVSTAKGVLQNLVEKIFPAPTSRAIMAMELLPKTETAPRISAAKRKKYDEFKKVLLKDMGWPGSGAQASSSTGKPVRRAAQNSFVNQAKRQKCDNTSSDEPSGDDDSEYEVDSSSSYSEPEEVDPFTKDPSLMAGLLSDTSSEEDLPLEDQYDDEGNYTGRKKKKTKKRKAAIKQPESTAPPTKEAMALAAKMKNELLEKIEVLGAQLPPNTLDQLIDELGGSSEVAEMTGRKGRVVQDDQGVVSYESRSETEVSLETINLKEKERFMTGEKIIAIISEAASSGISLQSDKRVKNQRQRVHITLELPWSADRAVQQFGRTHRSNQANAPEYVFLISNMAGEQRFASIIAKRLECLGALTHGDRRATETRDFSRYNIDTKYGRSALDEIMRAIMAQRPASIPFPTLESPEGEAPGDFVAAVGSALVGVGLIVNSPKDHGRTVLEKDLNIMKFLNRVLGMPIKIQNLLFQYFTDTLTHIVKTAKRNGRFDLGIVDISGTSKDVALVESEQYEKKHATGVAQIEMHKLYVNRGMPWEEALEKETTLTGAYEGFYLSKRVWNGKRTAMLIMRFKNDGSKEKTSDYYLVYKPNIGLQPGKEPLVDIRSKYEKVEADAAKIPWEGQYDASLETCVHAYWSGNCKQVVMGHKCEVGIRNRTYYVLSGSVLLIWGEVERVMAEHATEDEAVKMQVVRCRGPQFKIVGLLVPNHCVNSLREALMSTDKIVALGEEDDKMSSDSGSI